MKKSEHHTRLEKALISILSAVVALIFFMAVYQMTTNWEAHHKHMSDQVFSEWWANVIAWVLPVAYGVIGIALSFRPWRRVALWIALGSITLLTVYIILALTKAFGFYPCSCIGFKTEGTFQVNLRFNAKLLSVTLLAIAIERRWLVFIRANLLKRWRRRRKEVRQST